MLQATTTRRQPVSAIIGLGANLPSDHGPLTKTLQAALDTVVSDGVEIQSISRFYSTPCFPAGAGPDYVNAVAILRTRLSAMDLLSRLHKIEETMGRERIERWGQRVLDLDLLTFGDEITPDLDGFLQWQNLPISEQSTVAPEQLILPHPRIQDRAFVLVPMADIAPEWVHPVTGRSTRQMLGDLAADDVAQVVPL